MAVKILEAYEGTLEEDSPPDNERYEHSEMLLYKVSMCNIYPPNNWTWTQLHLNWGRYNICDTNSKV
jgi:hypothetical protein